MHSPDRRVADCYEVGEVLGQGGFGTVSLARGRQCDRECVLKVVDRDVVPNAAKLDQEVEIHAALDHPNIVRIYERFMEEQQLCIVMELCRGGELLAAVEKEGGVCSEAQTRNIFVQVMQAVNHMHRQGLVHRDLKLENFLIKEHSAPLAECTIKLIDFGLAARFTAGKANLKTMCGTPHYMAPEIFSEAPYDEKCDVWSCGVILYALLSGDLPFYGESVAEVIRDVKSRPLQFRSDAWSSVREDAKRLVMHTCTKVIARRYSAQEVLADAWLRKTEVDVRDPVTRTFTPDMLAYAEQFGEMTCLQRASLHRVAYHMDDEQMKGMREIFVSLDSDGDGKLTKEELLQGADEACLSELECARVAQLFDQLDSDGNGVLEYTEFLAAMTCHRSKMSRKACMAAFRSFDLDGSGSISAEEIRQIFARDGGSSQSVEQVLKRCDINGDGEICFDDFMMMLRESFDGPSSMIISATVGGA